MIGKAAGPPPTFAPAALLSALLALQKDLEPFNNKKPFNHKQKLSIYFYPHIFTQLSRGLLIHSL